MVKKLNVNGATYHLDTHKTLLENLEAHQLAVEYHCRDGYCGACKCRLVSGTVAYKKEPMAYLREGEILPCTGFSQDDIELSRY